jgi:hypothetical protein
MELKDMNLGNFEDRKKVIDLIQQYFTSQKHIKLKQISNNLAEDGALAGNKELVYLSFIPYILYKILTQPHILHSSSWKLDKEKIQSRLDEMEKISHTEWIEEIRNFKSLFRNSNKEMYYYIKNMLQKARVKLAARIHESGFSVNKARELTDVDRISLQRYLAESKPHNRIRLEEQIKEKIGILNNVISKNKMQIIFDSSTLISLGNTGMYNILESLKEKNIELLVPESVIKEAITDAKKINRFAWNAVNIQHLLNNGTLKEIKIDKKELEEFENKVNQIYSSAHGFIEIIQAGEAECIIYANNNPNVVFAVDEITTRLLLEKPHQLDELVKKRYRTKITTDENKLDEILKNTRNIKIIRSVDLIAFGYEKEIFKDFKQEDVLSAALYALKYNGCATSFEEIEEHLNFISSKK